jgi:hypothetical protein
MNLVFCYTIRAKLLFFIEKSSLFIEKNRGCIEKSIIFVGGDIKKVGAMLIAPTL